MALFKILRGEKSSLSSQEIHDGWAYFTPEDSGFYIDIANTIGDTEYSQRLRVNRPQVKLNVTLAPANWVDNQYGLTNSLFTEYYNISLECDNIILETYSDANRFAIMSALNSTNLVVKSSANGKLVLQANGTIPSVEIPIVIVCTPGGGK